MAKDNQGNITEEIDKRLRDIFGEGKAPEKPEQQNSSEIAPEETGVFPEFAGDIGNALLKELKATVLSIDWEINDEVMGRFTDQVHRLKKTFREDRVTTVLLQLLDALGKYVKTHKGRSHPQTIKVLTSVHAALEKVASSKEMGEREKKQILLKELKEFKHLREQVSSRKQEAVRDTAGGRREGTKPGEAPQRERAQKQPQVEPEQVEKRAKELARMEAYEAFAYALEEIRATIQAEFRALRAELKLMRREK